MFILVLIASVLLGFAFSGSLNNLSNANIRGSYFILAGFLIEFIINMLIIRGVINSSIVTYILDVVMYLCIIIFMIRNKDNPWLVLMGLGFILNAVAIFSNGGTMPVSSEHIQALNLTDDVTREGLYSLINEKTNFIFLCDIFPVRFITRFIFSVGDLIAAVGMMAFIVTSMTKKTSGTAKA